MVDLSIMVLLVGSSTGSSMRVYMSGSAHARYVTSAYTQKLVRSVSIGFVVFRILLHATLNLCCIFKLKKQQFTFVRNPSNSWISWPFNKPLFDKTFMACWKEARENDRESRAQASTNSSLEDRFIKVCTNSKSRTFGLKLYDSGFETRS